MFFSVGDSRLCDIFGLSADPLMEVALESQRLVRCPVNFAPAVVFAGISRPTLEQVVTIVASGYSVHSYVYYCLVFRGECR